MGTPLDIETLRHAETDPQGNEIEADYPADLVSALPMITAEHPRLLTVAVEAEPGIVVIRPLNAIEARRVRADGAKENKSIVIDTFDQLAPKVVVWPSPERFTRMCDAYASLAGEIGAEAFVASSGVRQAAKKGSKSSSAKRKAT